MATIYFKGSTGVNPPKKKAAKPNILTPVMPRITNSAPTALTPKTAAARQAAYAAPIGSPETVIPPPAVTEFPNDAARYTFSGGRNPYGETLPGYNPTPAQPANPFAETASNAGKAGLSLADTAALFAPTTDEERKQKDALAQQFGYGGYDDFAKEIFAKPSKTTEQFYRDAYNAAGLGELRAKMEQRRQQLAQAEGSINDNPWLAEASRVGRARRLQDLANADIATWQRSYELGAEQVRNLVAANATDLGTDERLREARFRYLTQTAEEAAKKDALMRVNQYLPQYLAGKNTTTDPKTVSVSAGQSVYRWNPTTSAFELVANNPAATKTDTSWQDVNGVKTLVDNATGRTIATLGGGSGSDRNSDLAVQASALIDTLKTHSGKSGAVGAKGASSFFGLKDKPIAGTAAAGFLSQLERLQSLLTLPNLQFMKGLGAMSEVEFRTIASAAAALNPNMSEAEFDAELTRIQPIMNSIAQKTSSGTSALSGGSVSLDSWAQF